MLIEIWVNNFYLEITKKERNYLYQKWPIRNIRNIAIKIKNAMVVLNWTIYNWREN